MPRIPEIPKNVTESMPLLAVVGATDVVIERVRAAAADAQKVQAGIEDALTTYQVELRKGFQAAQAEVGKTLHAYQVGLEPSRIQAKVAEAVQQLPTQVQQVPALAVSRALEVAGQVETGYAGLAERGKQLVERVREQQSTQDFLAQAGATSSLAKAAVTTARKAVGDTRTAARSAVTIGRHELSQAAPEVEQSVAETEKLVEKRTAGTRAAVKRTATTARTRATATRTAAKATATSARHTAEKAAAAAEGAAEQVGE